MILTFEQVVSITQGAVRVDKKGDLKASDLFIDLGMNYEEVKKFDFGGACGNFDPLSRVEKQLA